ncbi:tetratricopeptide repeat protein [Alloacidobacterium sp.]|uniref:tetratricopeptide repeat protein n=1 Tax=Alloacidobacterium sp. TaxID=2951999 RepID=UPI002D65F8E0|nr:tetratricopeptide repeat protein [Alloacidobacterium sp.]HYK34464.1 tetratricopeptide repeat protein [Alloacidobacterium sp.]
MVDIASIPGAIMYVQSTLRSTCLILILISAAALNGQTRDNGSLQQYYNHAQELQRTGKLSEAAEQYRAFLADALGELAMGYGLAKDYTDAAPLFDEALTFEPNSMSLLLDYAQMALVLGNPDHAKTLASEFIQKYPGDREELAQAHQVLGRAFLKLDRDQEARKELEAAVALDPTFPNGYDLAVACLDLEDEKCAAQIFNEMEKSFGDTPEIHMAFGHAYAESDFQSQALTEFKRTIEENPRLPGAHYSLATILIATGGDESHMESAEAELKKELAISPNDAMTYAALGKIAANRNHYPEAETYLKKAVALAPQSPDAYLYLGQMYFNMNRNDEAETALHQCIRLTTDVSRNRYQVQNAHFLLGRILMQKGQTEAAHAEMKTARELANKTLSQDKSKLAALIDTSGSQDLQASAAETDVSHATTADPVALRKVEVLKAQVGSAIADSYNNLGAITATNSDYAGAVAYFKRAAVWNPSLDGLDYNWGRAAFAGSQFADAISPLSRYVKTHPDDTGGRSVLAISQFMTGDYHGCIETLQPVIGKADLVPQVEYYYAESMISTGQIDSGMRQLELLEKLHPEIPDLHRSLGEALEQQGQEQKALEEFQTAVQLNPRDAESYYDLGKMKLDSGDPTAIQELEMAVRLLPDSLRFHQELADAYTAAHRSADARKEIETGNMLRTRTQNGAATNQNVTHEQ